jgi:hypothetical protein
MPARAKLQVEVEAPPTTPECGELYFCDPVVVTPAEGSPPFRSSGKGRAYLSFVMPDSYMVETDPFNPSTRRPSYFANGQSVHIDVFGVRNRPGVKEIGLGFSRAVVQIPAG